MRFMSLKRRGYIHCLIISRENVNKFLFFDSSNHEGPSFWITGDILSGDDPSASSFPVGLFEYFNEEFFDGIKL